MNQQTVKSTEEKDIVVVVTDMEQLEQVLENAGDKLVVVDFYADWCGPCKMIAPKVKNMAADMKDRVIFVKVNVDEAEDVAEKYAIEAMPTFKLFKNQKVVDVFLGANDVKLREKIEQNK